MEGLGSQKLETTESLPCEAVQHQLGEHHAGVVCSVSGADSLPWKSATASHTYPASTRPVSSPGVLLLSGTHRESKNSPKQASAMRQTREEFSLLTQCPHQAPAKQWSEWYCHSWKTSLTRAFKDISSGVTNWCQFSLWPSRPVMRISILIQT